jgi:NAD+ kinase
MSQSIPKTIGVFANVEKAGSADIAAQLARWLTDRRIRVLFAEDLAARTHLPELACTLDTLFDQSDLVVVLGGDGTLLTAAKHGCGKKGQLLGVNLGGLGFLAELNAGELFDAMENVLAGSYTVTTRLMLSAEAVSDDGRARELHGLNDVVVEKARDTRILTMDIEVAGQYVGTFVADGLIVATPTGSTAYSLSAGGPILEPRIDALIATPICAHSLAVRPLVFSSSEMLELTVRDSEGGANLIIDGQVQHELDNVRQLRVKQAKNHIKLARVSDRGFYDLLRSKLGWGSREAGTK